MAQGSDAAPSVLCAGWRGEGRSGRVGGRGVESEERGEEEVEERGG